MTGVPPACDAAVAVRSGWCSMAVIMWHPFVTCGYCGRIHECVRLVSDPCSFTLLCHGCEGLLTVTISGDQIADRRRKDWAGNHLEVRGAAPRRWARRTD